MSADAGVTDKRIFTATEHEPVTDSKGRRPCPRCGRPFFTLVKLHGDKGGPEMCMECGWEILESGRQKLDSRNKTASALLEGFGVRSDDPTEASPHEVSRELIDDILRLVHPDLHAPARRDLATKVSAELTRLRTHAKPRAKPKPPPVYRDASEYGSRGATKDALRTAREITEHPCTWLRPLHYCDECREKWEKAQREKSEQEAKRRRAARQRRRYRDLRHRHCIICEAPVPVSIRRDARTCSPACRQRAYRLRRKAAA